MTRRHSAIGFTLAELVVSMTIMTILIGGMASAVLLASRALPDEENPASRTAAAVAAVEQFAADLALAIAVTEARPGSVTLTVPDRGHGAAGPESIRYAWSGKPGDPLTRAYNGGTAVTVCENVETFALEYTLEVKPLARAPRVMLVVGNALVPTDKDTLRRQTIEGWDFPVQLLDDSAPAAAFEAAAAGNDVAYVSETVLSFDLGTKLRDARIGVVLEEGALYDEFGIAAGAWVNHDDEMDVIDNTHEITAHLATGRLAICTSNQDLVGVSGSLAPAARVLARCPGYASGSLVILDPGGKLHDGGTAAGRRVKLPWGNSSASFDFASINDAGLGLMRRAIVWAAAPVGIGEVRVTLQIGADAGGRVESQVQLLNVPEGP